jgi:hypothetical protein
MYPRSSSAVEPYSLFLQNPDTRRWKEEEDDMDT